MYPLFCLNIIIISRGSPLLLPKKLISAEAYNQYLELQDIINSIQQPETHYTWLMDWGFEMFSSSKGYKIMKGHLDIHP
jgi:hypothetical protein